MQSWAQKKFIKIQINLKPDLFVYPVMNKLEILINVSIRLTFTE